MNIFAGTIVHYTSVSGRIRNAILNPAWVCFLWAGATLGVSIIATPARSTAPSITRVVPLDVGRVVFAALNKVELLLLVALLIVVRVAGLSRQWWGIGAFLALVVIAQGVWLIPELAARTDLIISGVEPPPSYAHAVYSSLELGKITALLFYGFWALKERP
jgi:hypothetical protein